MYHNFVLVQKIEENALVKVHFAAKQYINWTYETQKNQKNKHDNPMFPLTILDKDCTIQEKPKGVETQCYKVSQNIIRFVDDYGVPEGFLICVTGPSGYYPKLIKFGTKPSIIVRDYNHVNPGIFDLYTNSVTKQASIVVHTTQRSLFSMIIDFEKCEDGFDIGRRTNYHDTFDFTLDLNKEHFKPVTVYQLKEVLTDVEGTTLNDIADMINELVQLVKVGEYTRINDSQKSKYADIIGSLISTSASAVTLLDSYMNHGSVGYMLKVIFDYFKQV